jgi:hypothetical protein
LIDNQSNRSSSVASSFNSKSYLPAGTLTLQLGMDADFQFYQANNSSSIDTLAALEDIVNSVDAIYSNQLGINVVLSDYNIFTKRRQPYKSLDTGTLLSRFSSYLRNNPTHLTGDTRHLMTGKNTSYLGNSTIVGLAYLGVVCSSTINNTGLSERTSSAIQHLVVAHELGHNFNANHDDATPSIMSSSVSANRDTFSNFSINEINTFLSGNSECLEDGTGDNDEDLTFAVKLNKSNRFKFVVTPNGFSTSSCTVNIYGAKNTTELNSSPTLILSRAGNSASGSKQTFSFSNSRKTPKTKAYFRAIVDCGGTEYNSTNKTLKANAGTDLRAVKVSGFINYLINKFN